MDAAGAPAAVEECLKVARGLGPLQGGEPEPFARDRQIVMPRVSRDRRGGSSSDTKPSVPSLVS